MSNPLSKFESLLDSGAVEEYATWCSFCNAEQASGDVDIQLNPNEPMMRLPIGPNCLEQAASEGFQVDFQP